MHINYSFNTIREYNLALYKLLEGVNKILKLNVYLEDYKCLKLFILRTHLDVWEHNTR